MLEEKNQERKFIQQSIRIKELEEENSTLDKEVEDLLKELEVTNETLSTFVKESKHFSEKNWEELRSLQEKLEKRISCEVENVVDPRELKKKYQERNIPSTWMFVR